MLWAMSVNAVLLQYLCGSQDGASPREIQMQMNCQETDENRTAISTACMNMLKQKTLKKQN